MAEKQKLFQVGGPSETGGVGGWCVSRSGKQSVPFPSPILLPPLHPHPQENNDLPVHLKGGTTDHLLYRLTMALTLGGKCGVSRLKLYGGQGGRVQVGGWGQSYSGFRFLSQGDLGIKFLACS